MCGQGEDTLRHRVIECKAPQVVAARKTALEKSKTQGWFQEFVRSPASYDIRLLRGFIPHPGCNFPRPTANRELHVINYINDESPAWGGLLFTDGSCTKERVPELNRAAYSIVMIDVQGKRKACATGAVPYGFPQTPQAAENLGAVAGIRLATTSGKLYGDCKNAVLNAASALRGETVRGAYAPQYREIREIAAKQFVTDSIWTKAHRSKEQAASEDDLLLFHGNDEADKAADSAVQQFHCVLSKTMKVMLGQQIARAKSLVMLATNLWSLWPSLPECDLPGGKKAKAAAREDLLFCDHRFRPIGPGGVRACKDCLRIYSPALAAKECRGTPEVAKKHASNPLGHGAVLLAGSRQPFLVCVRCGLWTEKRLVGLKRQCRGVLQGIGVGNVVRLLKGTHPHRNEPLMVDDATHRALRISLDRTRAHL